MSDFIRQNAINSSFTLNESWIILSEIEQSIKRKVETYGTPLKDWAISISYGIKTGCNEAFVVDRKKRHEILDNCKTPEEYKQTDAIIRPILRGRDIKKDNYEWAGLYCILAYFDFHREIDKYPAIYNHLKQYETALKRRGQARYTSNGKPKIGAEYPGQHHWLELDNNPRKEYMDDFSRQKIVFPAIMSQDAFFAVDKEGYVVVAPGNTLIGNIDFDSLLIYLCSVGYWALKHFYMGGGIEGELKVNRLMKLPIPNNLDKIQTVDDIYSELDFSEEEIRLISSSSK